MNEVYNRVASWNNKRYPREYNPDLTLDLLSEEYLEYFNSTELVDKVDALCDIIFVALGGVWKLDQDTDAATRRSQEVIKSLIYTQELLPVYYINSFLLAGTVNYPPMSMLWNVIQCATTQLSYIGLDEEGIQEVLLAVCDANDTKSASKTEPHIKANIDKGDSFVGPEPKLSEILKNRLLQ